MTPGATPLACRLDAIPPSGRGRHAELFSVLRSALLEVEELPDGFDFLFAKEDSAAALAEWLGLEKLCCPFLDFTVDAVRVPERVCLRVTGPEGTKSFLRTEFPIGENGR